MALKSCSASAPNLPTKKPVKLRRYLMEHDPKITHRQLAEVMGVPVCFVTHILNGRKKLPKRHLTKLAEYGIPLRLLDEVVAKQPGIK